MKKYMFFRYIETTEGVRVEGFDGWAWELVRFCRNE